MMVVDSHVAVDVPLYAAALPTTAALAFLGVCGEVAKQKGRKQTQRER